MEIEGKVDIFVLLSGGVCTFCVPGEFYSAGEHAGRIFIKFKALLIQKFAPVMCVNVLYLKAFYLSVKVALGIEIGLNSVKGAAGLSVLCIIFGKRKSNLGIKLFKFLVVVYGCLEHPVFVLCYRARGAVFIGYGNIIGFVYQTAYNVGGIFYTLSRVAVVEYAIGHMGAGFGVLGARNVALVKGVAVYLNGSVRGSNDLYRNRVYLVEELVISHNVNRVAVFRLFTGIHHGELTELVIPCAYHVFKHVAGNGTACRFGVFYLAASDLIGNVFYKVRFRFRGGYGKGLGFNKRAYVQIFKIGFKHVFRHVFGTGGFIIRHPAF